MQDEDDSKTCLLICSRSLYTKSKSLNINIWCSSGMPLLKLRIREGHSPSPLLLPEFNFYLFKPNNDDAKFKCNSMAFKYKSSDDLVHYIKELGSRLQICSVLEFKT